MTVSVIIPTYNHSAFVAQTLESIFAQTFRDFEVIVVNDGSPDDTADLLGPLVQMGRIKYIEQPNSGQAAARNRGLSEAVGEFVAFLDDDDSWPADKLEWQVAALRSNEVSLVGGWASVVNAEGVFGHESGSPHERIGIEEMADGCPFYSPGQVLIRRSALEEVGGFDKDIWGADDFDLYLKLARHGSLMNSRRISLYYRRHEANASRDRAQMLRNASKVVNRHFRGGDRVVAQRAFQWLYNYAGRDQVVAAKQAIRDLDPLLAASRLFELRPFLGPSLRDMSLARTIIHDILPKFSKPS